MRPMGQNQDRRYVSSGSLDGGTAGEVDVYMISGLCMMFWLRLLMIDYHNSKYDQMIGFTL